LRTSNKGAAGHHPGKNVHRKKSRGQGIFYGGENNRKKRSLPTGLWVGNLRGSFRKND